MVGKIDYLTSILQTYYSTETMDINLPGYKRIKDEARDFWMRVVTDLKSGLTVAQIAKRYTNPKTGTHYSREHIYWIIRQIKSMPAESI